MTSDVAIHDFGGPADGPVVLFSHATGFCGWTYQPIATHLTDRFHCLALDYRGFGDTPLPDGWDVDWWEYGREALDVVHEVADGTPILAFGHSMGGTALLMAALTDPDAFAGIVTFEPIIFPAEGLGGPAADGNNSNPLANGARRRRASFDSFRQAFDNFAAKPPFDNVDPVALRAYVDHGFFLGEDTKVHLKCTPAHEADTFEAAGKHHFWDRLPEVHVSTWVYCGAFEAAQPAVIAPRIAERIPDGHFEQFTEFNHFGPLQAPARFAELIGTVAAEVGLSPDHR